MKRGLPQKNKKGFSLVELVIVILIIVVLAVAVFAGGSSAIRKSRVSRAESDLHNYDVALTSYMFEQTTMVGSDSSSDFVSIANGINDYLPAGMLIDTSFTLPMTGDICNSNTELCAFQTEKEDPWGNPYIILLDPEARNDGHTEYFITVASAGPNGSTDAGGTLDDDDIFLLLQYQNGVASSNAYNMSVDTEDSTGTALVAGESGLSIVGSTGPAPRNLGETMDNDGDMGAGSSGGGAAGTGGSSGGGTTTAHTHSYVATSASAATCTSAGSKTLTCSKCGATKTQSGIALGHLYGEYVTTTDATCTTDGTKTASCSRSGCTAVQTQTIPALGHDFVLTATAVSSSDGKHICDKYTCSRCETVDEQNKRIALTSIAVTTSPARTWYVPGKNFDSRGMVVTATYTDGSTSEITGYTLSGNKNLTSSSTAVSITYEENGVTASTTQPITMEGVPTLKASSTWYAASSVTRSQITSIEIVTDYDPYGKDIVDQWKASSEYTIMAYLEDDGTGNGTYKLTIAGNGSDFIYANSNSANVFRDFTRMATFVGADVLDTSRVTTLERAFYDCYSLTSLDLNSWNTSKVESLLATFNGMLALESLNVKDWDTSNVQNMRGTFQCSVALTELDLSGWTVDNVTTMMSMFCGLEEYGGAMKLSKIIGLDDWQTGKVEDMSFMFWGCISLEYLDVSRWDVSRVTTFNGTFGNYGGDMALKNLDVSNWNLKSCTDISVMFQRCSSLTNLDVSNWQATNITNTMHAFYNCSSLEALDFSSWDFSNVSSMYDMMYGCSALNEVIFPSNMDTSNCVEFSSMFGYCSNLTELDLSGFDTRNAKDGISLNVTSHPTSTTMRNMFSGMSKLTKITLGKNFSFDGDGTTEDATHHAVLPTPSGGYWYTEDGTAYTPAEVAANHSGTVTYYAVNPCA